MDTAMKPIPRRQAVVENALATVLMALVWLAPNHQAPWGSFHHELLMATVMAITCVVVLWQTRWALPVSRFALLVLLAAALPWMQLAAGLLPKSGTALISSAYLAAVALAICVGQAGAVATGQRFFHILFGALALAAALNVPVQVIQWSQWYSQSLDSVLMLLVTPISAAHRPSGMILQPNQLATIQVWGLIGLTWFRYQRSIGMPLFLAGFAFICVGIGLTQSRAGLLEMMVVLVLMVVAWRSSPRRDIAWTWVFAIGLLVVWGLNFAVVAEWLGVKNDAIARLSAIDGARLDAWRAFWGAVLERPWAGYGLSDAGHAYVALATERPDMFIGQRFAHAHNAVLDLVLWVGLPLGLLIAGAFLIWLGQHILVVPQRPEMVFPLGMLLALGLHAMLELPHQFLYFIAPAGLCIGWLCSAENSHSTLELPRWTWGAAAVIVVAVSAPIALDYFPYQERYTEWRFENQRIGKRPDIEVHKPLVLDQIHDELALYRLPMVEDMPDKQLDWISETARAINSPPAFYAAAKAFALAGKQEDARTWMMRFNAIMDAKGVEQMKFIWRKDQSRHSALAGLAWPEYQGRTSSFVMAPLDASPNLLPTEVFEKSFDESPPSASDVR